MGTWGTPVATPRYPYRDKGPAKTNCPPARYYLAKTCSSDILSGLLSCSFPPSQMFSRQRGSINANINGIRPLTRSTQFPYGPRCHRESPGARFIESRPRSGPSSGYVSRMLPLDTIRKLMV